MILADEISDSGSANYNIRAAGGFDQKTIAVDEQLIPELENTCFPCIAKLDIDSIFSRGQAKPIVRSFNLI